MQRRLKCAPCWRIRYGQRCLRSVRGQKIFLKSSSKLISLFFLVVLLCADDDNIFLSSPEIYKCGFIYSHCHYH